MFKNKKDQTEVEVRLAAVEGLLADTQARLTITEGRCAAYQVLLQCIINRLSDTQQLSLIETLKKTVGGR